MVCELGVACVANHAFVCTCLWWHCVWWSEAYVRLYWRWRSFGRRCVDCESIFSFDRRMFGARLIAVCARSRLRSPHPAYGLCVCVCVSVCCAHKCRWSIEERQQHGSGKQARCALSVYEFGVFRSDAKRCTTNSEFRPWSVLLNTSSSTHRNNDAAAVVSLPYILSKKYIYTHTDRHINTHLHILCVVGLSCISARRSHLRIQPKRETGTRARMCARTKSRTHTHTHR